MNEMNCQIVGIEDQFPVLAIKASPYSSKFLEDFLYRTKICGNSSFNFGFYYVCIVASNDMLLFK